MMNTIVTGGSVGANMFARVLSVSKDTGKLSLTHATHQMMRD